MLPSKGQVTVAASGLHKSGAVVVVTAKGVVVVVVEADRVEIRVEETAAHKETSMLLASPPVYMKVPLQGAPEVFETHPTQQWSPAKHRLSEQLYSANPCSEHASSD